MNFKYIICQCFQSVFLKSEKSHFLLSFLLCVYLKRYHADRSVFAWRTEMFDKTIQGATILKLDILKYVKTQHFAKPKH